MTMLIWCCIFGLAYYLIIGIIYLVFLYKLHNKSIHRKNFRYFEKITCDLGDTEERISYILKYKFLWKIFTCVD